MDFQFYPTPPKLVKRAWGMFKNRHFARVLEPSAGNGDLAKGFPEKDRYYRTPPPIDCCEIDISKHAVLREAGLNVVGLDFLEFGSGAMYTHVILNPPFADGAKHVLKAWDILWNGEIVAIINAETVRNPFSKERQFLVDLIDKHGKVEIIEGAFTVEEAERKTAVDVAMIYLKKEADVTFDVTGDLFDELRRDAENGEGLSRGFEEANMLSLPSSTIENMVLSFNAAVKAMRDSVFAEARAAYYSNLLGDTMEVRSAEQSSKRSNATTIDFVQKELGNRYITLKNQAWAGVLRSTNVTSKLSSKAQQRVESQFEQIKQLSFTTANVYGFLCGLVEQQGEIQLSMACDVFDTISKFHDENTVYFKGWVSNSKHRTCGMRLKTTRFILPGHRVASWRSNLDWDSRQQLADFDKIFAMLDGKNCPQVGLVDVFETHFNELKDGERVSSSYFDVRFYPGAGTIHFFPSDKALVDRLNRLVGKIRKWLPPENARVSDAFWLQYDKAEKFDKEVREEIRKRTSGRWWDNPMHKLNSTDETERSTAAAAVDEAVTTVLERHGIDVDFRIENETQQQTLLLEAA